jgi:trehalose utilization protein
VASKFPRIKASGLGVQLQDQRHVLRRERAADTAVLVDWGGRSVGACVDGPSYPNRSRLTNGGPCNNAVAVAKLQQNQLKR